MSAEKSARSVEQQITTALAAARASKSGLIRVSQLPTPWQYNAHVVEGYRFTKSHRHCVRSVFGLHNESFNIWSHLLGCLLLVRLLLSGSPEVTGQTDGTEATLFTIIYYTYLLAALLCTACSVAWHTMRCIASHRTMSLFSSLDLTGVTTLVIASVLVTQLVALSPPPAGSPDSSSSWLHGSAGYTYQHGCMAVSAALGAAALAACWLPVMCRPENSWTRVLVWIALGVQGVFLPAALLLWHEGPARTAHVYAPLVPAYGPIVFGAVVYAAQFPECCWPGKFDYLGASHNILHVASLAAIWFGIKALRDLYDNVGMSSP